MGGIRPGALMWHRGSSVRNVAQRGGTGSFSFDLVPDDGAEHRSDDDVERDPDLDPDRDPPEPVPAPPTFAGRTLTRLRRLPRRHVLIGSAVAVALVAVGGAGVYMAKSAREQQRVDLVVAAPGGVRSLADEPAELWSVETDAGVLAILTDGVVATRSGTEILGIDAATGGERWRLDLGGQSQCGPTPWSPAERVRASSRLVCLSGPDEARRVTVVDSAGAVVARRELPPIEMSERAPSDGSGIRQETPSHFAMPAADGGLLVVERTGPRPAVRTFTTQDEADRAMEEGLERGQGATVRMEDAATGTVRWEHRLPFVPVGNLSGCATVNTGGGVIAMEAGYTHVVSQPSHVAVSGCGVNAAFTPDGRSTGDVPPDAPWLMTEVTPYVDGGLVVWSRSMNHVLLDDVGRRVLELPGLLLNPLATDGTGGETLLVAAGSELVAMNRSGRELWNRDLMASEVSHALVRADGVVVIADGRGGVRAVELTTGNTRWSVDPGELLPVDDPWSGSRFAATDGRSALIAVSNAERTGTRLVAVDLRSGRVVWEAQRDGESVELMTVRGVLVENVATGTGTTEVAPDGTTALSTPGTITGRGRK